MSGSSGGGFGGGFERSGVSCEDLIINTQLGSPRAAVIPSLQIGTELDVQVQQQNNISVVVLVLNNQIAGGITAPEVQQLRECIQAGTVYAARVTNISGAHVGVRIAAIPSA
ncbi:MAG TPA: hypothetical protein VFN09_12725 [Rhodanobacteraceae bacterium]|nr:hypothetical protein [Rhodanobacteraceae bacterium]